ncbi:epoxide hydrolase family protein [Streptomyces sp. NPDC057621]|uniref:epoxide hydrolase family protein n=1 Tax=Streptomyces sp. NPDC057621 TaxID=3346186 RepID=UPI00367AA6BA
MGAGTAGGRPESFAIRFPDSALEDLARRLELTRFAPDLDNESGRYGLSTAHLRRLVSYWRDGYDWRAQEKLLNTLPHARVELDGIPVHFVHVRGRGPAPRPLLMSHGFPWTFWDFQRVLGPLTDPAAHGGDPADAFDVVVPSLPGFALSTPMPRAGVSFLDTADLWVRLMRDVLGYDRFGAQGGDWGALVTAQLGHKYAEHLTGVHFTSVGSLPGAWSRPRPWNLLQRAVDAAAPEHRDAVVAWERRRIGHIAPQVAHPQTLAHALHDSPAGLLAWLTERRMSWADPALEPADVFDDDFLITSTMLYWLTGSYVNAARFYHEAAARPWQPSHDRTPLIEVPTGLSIFPDDNPPGATYDHLDELYPLVHVGRHESGGHFGPMERPDEVVADIRATFRSSR